VVFNYPTAASLATHLLVELDRGGPAPDLTTDLDLLVLRLVAGAGQETTARLLREAALSLETPSLEAPSLAGPGQNLAGLADEELFSLLDRELNAD
jgi:hypothetical protein